LGTQTLGQDTRAIIDAIHSGDLAKAEQLGAANRSRTLPRLKRGDFSRTDFTDDDDEDDSMMIETL
jgi:hypothetical protein